MLAFGNPGSGKTHLLCAIAQELIHQGRQVRFTPCNILVQELLIAKRDLKLARVLKQYAKYEALIIDDIGYVLQGWEEMKVPFTLLANHYEHGSLEADLAKAEPVNSIGIQANDEVKALAR